MGKKIEKVFDPLEGVTQVPFESPIVEFVDSLLEFANKNGTIKGGIPRGRIVTEGDWETMEFLYRGWKILYPTDAFEFEKMMMKLRRKTLKKGVNREGEAIIQHVGNIPIPLYKMMLIVFPRIIWDHKFVVDFAKHMPQFRSFNE